MNKPTPKTKFNHSVIEWNHRQGRDAALKVFDLALSPYPSLEHFDLDDMDLFGIDFSGYMMNCASFQKSQLQFSRFCETRLGGADFSGANLTGSDFSFSWCDGTGAKSRSEEKAHIATCFYQANLDRVTFHNSHLRGADFRGASLLGTKFIDVDLAGANFSDATFGHTVFCGTDLSKAIGLNSLVHKKNSFFDISTTMAWKGEIPQDFMKQCGFTIELISQLETLINSNPVVFLSYAWGDDSPQGQAREQAADRLYQELCTDFIVHRDRDELKPGELISDFIDKLIHGKFIVALISDKYLRSPYCMLEIYKIYQACQGTRKQLVERVIPVVMPEVRLARLPERYLYLEYWREEVEKYETIMNDPKIRSGLGEASLNEYRIVRDVANHVDEILSFLADVLMPRKVDDFSAVRGVLRRKVGWEQR